MTHLKLTLAYDGTPFVGWQRQAGGESIQGLIEDALGLLDKRPVVVHGSGRTDAGVHALGQVVSVALERDIDPATVRRALNAHLPPTIRVLAVDVVDPQFHARFSATSKVYRYRIWNAEVQAPFERLTSWHFPSPHLDVAAMAQAAAHLLGRHDFSSFQGTGATTHTAERTLYVSHVTRGGANAETDHDPLVVYEVCGNGFLRHMVRSIVGTLVEVGRGRRAPDSIREILSARARPSAGETAPACGLFLVRVSYDLPDL